MEAEKRWWLWRPPEDARYIGRRGIERKDARQKASGQALYSRDIKLPGMVYAKPLSSPYAHARIKNIPKEEILAMKGVVDVVSWDDPMFQGRWPLTRGVPYLSDEALFYGQPVGMIVVAEREEVCDEALRLAKAKAQWEELPFTLAWEENEQEAELPPLDWQMGDVEEALRQADRILEFTVRKSEEDTWAGVEPGVAVADFDGEALHIWHYGQGPFGVRTILSSLFGIPENRITVHAPHHGALFGGVTWLAYPDALAAIAAVLAMRLKRPVKILDDYTSFRGAEWQLGTYHFKVGFKMDGTITAVKLGTKLVGIPIEPTILKLLEGTAIPNIALHAEWPRLNRCFRICYRHGSHFCNVVTYVINRVAAELDMDPTEVALKNDGWHGHSMAWLNEHVKPKEGFDPRRDSLQEVIRIGKKAIGWEEKWHAPGKKRLPNGNYHGIGFMAVEQWAWVPFPVGNIPRPITAAIRVNKDGSAEIYGWRADGGTGFSTSYCQVVADELGLSFDRVSHSHFDDHGFVLWQMGGSAGNVSNLICIIAAARRAKRLILEYAPLFLENFAGKTPEELEIRENFIFEKANPDNRSAVSQVSSRITIFAAADLFEFLDVIANEQAAQVYKKAAFQPRFLEMVEPYAKPNLVRQAHFVEIEVDPETGGICVKKAVIVNDVGRVINPEAVNGQQYGGAYMGLGRNHLEAIYYDPLTGVRLNDSLLGYPVPLMNDVGPIDCHIVETGLAYGPYGMAGCSEAVGAALSMILGPAVYNAIGVWVDDFPITPDKILKALRKI